MTGHPVRTDCDCLNCIAGTAVMGAAETLLRFWRRIRSAIQASPTPPTQEETT